MIRRLFRRWFAAEAVEEARWRGLRHRAAEQAIGYLDGAKRAEPLSIVERLGVYQNRGERGQGEMQGTGDRVEAGLDKAEAFRVGHAGDPRMPAARAVLRWFEEARR